MKLRPMETAPKNPAGGFVGPFILVYCTADGMSWPAQWAEGGTDGTGCWRIYGGEKPSDEIWPEDAGGWMPLPEPPTEADVFSCEHKWRFDQQLQRMICGRCGLGPAEPQATDTAEPDGCGREGRHSWRPWIVPGADICANCGAMQGMDAPDD